MRRLRPLLVQGVGDRIGEVELSSRADGGVPGVGSVAAAGGREERRLEPSLDGVLLLTVAV